MASVSFPAPPSGTETDRLAKHDQQRAQETRASSIERNVGVQGVSGQEQLRPVTAERVAEQGRGGGKHVADERQATHSGSLVRALKPGRNGGKRRKQTLDQGRSDDLPLIMYRLPGGAVTGVLGIKEARGDLEVAVQHDPRIVGPRMAEHSRRAWPSAARSARGADRG